MPLRVRAIVAAIALAVGVIALLGSLVSARHENLPYSAAAAAPRPAHVTSGRTYSLALPGGVTALTEHGVQTQSNGTQVALECTWTADGSAPQPLTLTAEAVDTKATNTVAHFSAPITGVIQASCAGWGAVYVPDADDRPTDVSGFMVVIACVALTLGLALALSASYDARGRRYLDEAVSTAGLRRSAGQRDAVEGTVRSDVADWDVTDGHPG